MELKLFKNRRTLDNLAVVLSMFLWALGLPIMDFEQEGWDGFSLSTGRTLFAGLTMLGLALYKRPFIFKKKELVVSFLLGIFGYGLASLLLIIGIGHAGAVTVAIIAALERLVEQLHHTNTNFTTRRAP